MGGGKNCIHSKEMPQNASRVVYTIHVYYIGNWSCAYYDSFRIALVTPPSFQHSTGTVYLYMIIARCIVIFYSDIK